MVGIMVILRCKCNASPNLKLNGVKMTEVWMFMCPANFGYQCGLGTNDTNMS